MNKIFCCIHISINTEKKNIIFPPVLVYPLQYICTVWQQHKKIGHMLTGLFCVSLCVTITLEVITTMSTENFCEKVSRIDALFVHHSSSTSVATWRNLIVIYIGWFFFVSEFMCACVCVFGFYNILFQNKTVKKNVNECKMDIIFILGHGISDQ